MPNNDFYILLHPRVYVSNGVSLRQISYMTQIIIEVWVLRFFPHFSMFITVF